MLPQNQNIRTFARIKPLFANEEKAFYKRDICTVVSRDNHEFSFDHVFDQNSTNREVYAQTSQKILNNSLKGYNSCILAYGQTSSGKTHTMKGTQQNPGLIPMCLVDMFTRIEQQRLIVRVSVSYIEIYNQNVIDLLSLKQNAYIQLMDDQNKNIRYPNLTEQQVKNSNEAMIQFQKGQTKRKFASNNVNDMSSRSHTIFKIKLTVVQDEDYKETSSEINLVDLAGSQSLQKTKGQKISKTEGENINKSILALNIVIKSMSQNSNSVKFINFRDSKLTRILQKSLCENSKSMIICMINPTRQNHAECLNTLKFGQTAAKIKIQARKNLIKNQERLKKQNQLQQTSLSSSERMDLESLRNERQAYLKEFEDLRNNNQRYQLELNSQAQRTRNAETYLRIKHQENENLQRLFGLKQYEFQITEQQYLNRIKSLQGKIQDGQKIYKQLKAEYKQLQKNEKGVVQTLQYYQNQCRNLNTQVTKLKNQINEQSSRSKKIDLSQQYNKKQKKQPKRNPFYLQPYRPDPNRPSSIQLSSIIILKTQIIDLLRQIHEFTKANIQIVEENEDLRRQLQEHRQKQQKPRTSSKISPEILQNNQIKRLNRKVKSLKQQLRIIKERQNKNQKIIKENSRRTLADISEFEEWFNKKHNKDFNIERQVQTLTEQQLKRAVEDQIKKQQQQQREADRKWKIQMGLHHDIQIDPQQNLRLNFKSSDDQQQKMLNSPNRMKRQNPEQRQKMSMRKSKPVMDQYSSFQEQKKDIEIDALSSHSHQIPRNTCKNRNNDYMSPSGLINSSKKFNIFQDSNKSTRSQPVNQFQGPAYFSPSRISNLQALIEYPSNNPNKKEQSEDIQI